MTSKSSVSFSESGVNVSLLRLSPSFISEIVGSFLSVEKASGEFK